jgi:hypothetical protein
MTIISLRVPCPTTVGNVWFSQHHSVYQLKSSFGAKYLQNSSNYALIVVYVLGMHNMESFQI